MDTKDPNEIVSEFETLIESITSEIGWPFRRTQKPLNDRFTFVVKNWGGRAERWAQ